MALAKIQQVSAGAAVHVPGDDIDTDRIIPARFLKCVTFDGLGEHLFNDVRFRADGSKTDHPLNDPRFRIGAPSCRRSQLRLRLFARACAAIHRQVWLQSDDRRELR